MALFETKSLRHDKIYVTDSDINGLFENRINLNAVQHYLAICEQNSGDEFLFRYVMHLGNIVESSGELEDEFQSITNKLMTDKADKKNRIHKVFFVFSVVHNGEEQIGCYVYTLNALTDRKTLDKFGKWEHCTRECYARIDNVIQLASESATLYNSDTYERMFKRRVGIRQDVLKFLIFCKYIVSRDTQQAIREEMKGSDFFHKLSVGKSPPTPPPPKTELLKFFTPGVHGHNSPQPIKKKDKSPQPITKVLLNVGHGKGKLLREPTRSTGEYLQDSELRRVGQQESEFSIGQQHDAHEALGYLLEITDLNQEIKYTETETTTCYHPDGNTERTESKVLSSIIILTDFEQDVFTPRFGIQTAQRDYKCDGGVFGVKQNKNTTESDFVITLAPVFQGGLKQPQSTPDELTSQDDTVYESVAKIYNHPGKLHTFGSVTNSSSGHYTSCVRRGYRWWECNDNTVREVTREYTQREQPYITLYAKQPVIQRGLRRTEQPVGIRNFGNTCYLNSCIQLLRTMVFCMGGGKAQSSDELKRILSSRPLNEEEDIQYLMTIMNSMISSSGR